MKFRTLVTVAALAAPVTVLAMGSNPSWHTHKSKYHTRMPASKAPTFKKADTNHDGKIEWSEAKADGVPKKLFKQDDFNHTGKLSKSEWHFVRLEMPAKPPH